MRLVQDICVRIRKKGRSSASGPAVERGLRGHMIANDTRRSTLRDIIVTVVLDVERPFLEPMLSIAIVSGLPKRGLVIRIAKLEP